VETRSSPCLITLGLTSVRAQREVFRILLTGLYILSSLLHFQLRGGGCDWVQPWGDRVGFADFAISVTVSLTRVLRPLKDALSGVE